MFRIVYFDFANGVSSRQRNWAVLCVAVLVDASPVCVHPPVSLYVYSPFLRTYQGSIPKGISFDILRFGDLLTSDKKVVLTS